MSPARKARDWPDRARAAAVAAAVAAAARTARRVRTHVQTKVGAHHEQLAGVHRIPLLQQFDIGVPLLQQFDVSAGPTRPIYSGVAAMVPGNMYVCITHAWLAQVGVLGSPLGGSSGTSSGLAGTDLSTSRVDKQDKMSIVGKTRALNAEILGVNRACSNLHSH